MVKYYRFIGKLYKVKDDLGYIYVPKQIALHFFNKKIVCTIRKA
jgi:hypothetical protein